MLIDWFTVGAQGLNFVVLVWLMKRFLYAPVQDAIAAREKRIADELAGADRQRADARTAAEDLAARGATFDRERAGLLESARNAAEEERVRLMATARVDADELTAQRRERLDAESRALVDALQQRTRDGVFAIARKALSDVASTTLEASACELFIARVRGLDGTPRASLGDALKAESGRATVRSAFELSDTQRAALARAVDETFASNSTLTFETSPALVCGIELSTHDAKVSWCISNELDELERSLAALLQAEPAAVGATP